MYVAKQNIHCDVLVIGGGLAGCLAALEAKKELGPEGRVVIVDKGYLSRSGQSPFAAGIWTFFDPEQDSLDQWMEEVITWGEFLNDQAWCQQLFSLGHVVAKQLDDWATQLGKQIFRKDEYGKMIRRRSRGHDYTRHVVIDSLAMMDTLRKRLQQDGVQIVDRVMITELFCGAESMRGAAGFNYRQEETYLFHSPVVILSASGSAFKSIFMGHRNLTGDLQAEALEQGVILTNMEQFYSNTVCRDYDTHGMNLYVGVGGKFLNGRGEEFMPDYHQLSNRAPLQNLNLAFAREVAEGRGPIYLDITSASAEDRKLCREVLPESFRIWDRAGRNPFDGMIPWVSSLRGTCAGGGGIKIDLNCRTNRPGLFAAGDICWIGPHGTYSIGGVNIGFTSVSGYVAGQQAAIFQKNLANQEPKVSVGELKERFRQRLKPLTITEGVNSADAIRKLQEVIVPYQVAYFKNAETLKQAYEELEQLEIEVLPRVIAYNSHELVAAVEVVNMVKLAKVMVQSSLAREESRGFHFRVEHPYTDNVNWLKLILVQQGEDRKISLWTEQVETPYVQPKDQRSLPPGAKRTGNVPAEEGVS